MSSQHMLSLCGGLNVIGAHEFIGSGTIRRCSFVGVGMTLLEQVSLWGWAQDTKHLSRLPVACKMKHSQL